MSEKNLRNVIAENPLLILFLGACPAMGATATFMGALGMGIAALVVMLLSGVVIAALKKAVPECARISAYVIVIAGFVSLAQMLMNAFLPDVYRMMGIYLAVAAVNLLVFGNCEDAEKGSVGAAAVNAVKIGVLFIAVLAVMGAIREVLGEASFAGIEISCLKDYASSVWSKAPGGFIVYSLLAGAISALCKSSAAEGKGIACAAAGIACCCEEEVEQ